MNKSRTLVVVATAIASILVLGKSIVNPAVRSSEVETFIFPQSVPLPQSKLLFSGSVNPYLVQPPAYISGDFISGKHYRYLYQEKYVDIEMRYVIDTNGDLKSFITKQTGELLPTLQQDRTRGFYSLYADRDKAYLSACINSRGGSTVTNDRFNRNRLIYDAHINRIFPWLLGEAELKDRRCLWAHLSIPLDGKTSIEETYQNLETVWFNWYDWWSLRFPS